MVRLSPPEAWALLCGLGLGLGLWLLVAAVARLRPPTLAERVAPYLGDVSRAARSLADTRAGSLLDGAFSRVAERAVAASGLADAAALRVRLRRAGVRLGVRRYRAATLLAGVLGGGVGTALLEAPALASAPLSARLAVPPLAAGLAAALPGTLLRRRERARARRLAAEVPTVFEFLALSLAAGEGVLDALRRVGRVGRGDLAREIGAVVAAVGSGTPLVEALRALSTEVRLPAVSRGVDALVAALERGTPLAEVLRAQARDAREEAKRGLIESAGRKEIAMLLPLVFFILPTTVLFAILPGVFVLRAGF